ncbi:MAG TPA: hypothetical protein PKM21_18940 [Anaerolineales bacterium]|nr:hypothetical protein [Anaerolineales bacterium]
MTTPPSPTRSDSFYARVDDAQRQALLQAYIDHLQARNGQLDPSTGRLPRREASLETMNASDVRYAGQVSQAHFDRLYANFSASDPHLDPALLLLLLFCKMNAGEAYGVRVVKAVHARRWQQSQDLPSRAIAFAQEEEEYHTRILVGAAHHFNIQAGGEYVPRLALKVLIGSLAYAPRLFFFPILYASEVAGVYIFNWTLKRVRSLIPDQPQLAEALEQRLIEIIIDEIGHVGFNRLVLGEQGRGLGRLLAGQTARGLPLMTPELGAAGFDASALRGFANFDLHDLPEQARQRAFFA